MPRQKEIYEYSKEIDNLISAGSRKDLEGFLDKIKDVQFSNSKDQSYFYYILGTGYSVFFESFHELWKKETIGKAVKFFLKAMYEEGFNDLTPGDQGKIFTNFGCALQKQGREFEAIAEFNKAIEINNNPIALLKKGTTLLGLSNKLFDEDHCLHYQYKAHSILEYLYAKKLDLFDQDHIHAMNNDTYTLKFLDWYNKNIEFPEEEPTITNRHNRRKNTSKKESAYINWCNKNTLYINNLNEISNDPGVTQDTLTLPDLVHLVNPLTTTSETLALNAAFSEIKHQYAFARFNYFDAITSDCSKKEIKHFSDKHLYLVNSLDYCLYRRDIEMTKVSFRLIYSCFDKISMLMKKYLTLDIKESQVTFRGVWFKDTERNKIREYFLNSNNQFLLALYWLSRDINDDEDASHTYWIDTNALKLADIRNKMEHQSFRVAIDSLHKINVAHTNDKSTQRSEITHQIEELQASSNEHLAENLKKIAHLQSLLDEKDNLLGYPLMITDVELRNQTMRLMKKARYAIIYLALGIHHAEKQKTHDGPIIGIDVPML